MHKFALKGMMLLIALASIHACSSKKGFKANNYSYLYQPNVSVLKPQYYVYHHKADSSTVFFKIDKSNLLYMRNDAGTEFTAHIKLRYALIRSYENPEILDSGSFEVSRISQGEGFLQSKFEIESKVIQSMPKALLAITVEDFNRKYEYTKYITLARQKGLGAQNFLVKDTLGAVIFDPFLAGKIPLQIIHNQESLKPLKVYYYNRETPLALPPFSQSTPAEFDLHADSTFYHLALETFVPKKPGIYHFSIDDNQMLGYTLKIYPDDYPRITKKYQLTEPMRYITTKKEYEYLNEHLDPDSLKYRADEFWLTRVGSVERGKQLVSAYYNRVADANSLFSTHIEGWKTDRGLIYIIFGEPTYTYRYDASEVWIYGDENSALQYRFDFEWKASPFSMNEYELLRNGNYKYLWSQAIDAWRNGRIYNVRDIKREQDERDQQIRYQRQPYFWY